MGESWLVNVPELIQHYGYLAVAVGTFLEGETVLLLAGAAASRGHLALPTVIGVATLASFAGDQLFFLLGRRHGSRLLARWPSLHARTAPAVVSTRQPSASGAMRSARASITVSPCASAFSA